MICDEHREENGKVVDIAITVPAQCALNHSLFIAFFHFQISEICERAFSPGGEYLAKLF
jgi:hypothetical protein